MWTVPTMCQRGVTLLFQKEFLEKCAYSHQSCQQYPFGELGSQTQLNNSNKGGQLRHQGLGGTVEISSSGTYLEKVQLILKEKEMVGDQR